MYTSIKATLTVVVHMFLKSVEVSKTFNTFLHELNFALFFLVGKSHFCKAGVVPFPVLDFRYQERSQAFTSPSLCVGKYESHTRVHTGEKPFQCDVCHQCYSTKSNLTVHKKKHNIGVPFHKKEHRCPFCNKLHASRKTLAKHVRR